MLDYTWSITVAGNRWRHRCHTRDFITRHFLCVKCWRGGFSRRILYRVKVMYTMFNVLVVHWTTLTACLYASHILPRSRRVSSVLNCDLARVWQVSWASRSWTGSIPLWRISVAISLRFRVVLYDIHKLHWFPAVSLNSNRQSSRLNSLCKKDFHLFIYFFQCVIRTSLLFERTFLVNSVGWLIWSIIISTSYLTVIRVASCLVYVIYKYAGCWCRI